MGLMVILRMSIYLSTFLLFCTVACGQERNTETPMLRPEGTTPIDAVIDTIKTTAGSPFVVERTEGIDPRYEPVIKRLVRDGFEETFVRDLFEDDHTVYIPKMAAVKPRKPVNSSDWYTWVNTDESAQACLDFIATYDSLLSAVEKQYGVDKETIAALLRCETRHGTITGDYHVLSVYASMALMEESWAVSESVKNAREQMADEGKSKAAIDKEVAYIKGRMSKRGGWAYKELKNLVTIHKNKTMDVRTLNGSWAGAFGWAQFLPSSYRRLAADGDGDGTIDLYNPADAIHSVANYLDRGGYVSGSAAKIKKSLKSYNPSNDYANAIYGLSVRVGKGMAASK